MKVGVVGAGVMGLSAGSALARRGHEVTILEQHGVGNPLGSSGGTSRIWRLTDGDADLVDFGIETEDGWARLEVFAGHPLRARHGIVIAGTESTRWAAHLSERGLPLEDVPRGAFRIDSGRPACFSPDAGTVFADRALAAIRAEFVAYEGVVEIARVDAVEPGDSPAVVIAGVRREFERLVVAAGPWTGRLLAGLGIDLALTPFLEQVNYYAYREGAAPVPCIIDLGEDAPDGPPALYAMPDPGGVYKIGLEQEIGLWSAEDDGREPSDSQARRIDGVVAGLIPGLVPRSVRGQVCTWTGSLLEGDWIFDELAEGVVVACRDSGKSFKYLPQLGEVIGDVVEGRRTRWTERFALA